MPRKARSIRKPRSARQYQHMLETLEVRTLLSSDPGFSQILAPNTGRLPQSASAMFVSPFSRIPPLSPIGMAANPSVPPILGPCYPNQIVAGSIGSFTCRSSEPVPLGADEKTLFYLNGDGTLHAHNGATPITSSGVTYVDGIIGQGIHIGSQGSVQYAAENNVNPQAGTIEFWYKPDYDITASNVNKNLITIGSPHDSRNTMEIVIDGACNLVSYFNDGTNIAGVGTSATGFVAGEWYYIAVTWSEDGVQLYVNGNLKSTTSSNPGLERFGYDTPPIITLGGYFNDDGGISGALDELRISSVARSASEIDADYRKGLSTPAYNAHDWEKYAAAVENNGLMDSHVTWTEIDGELRLTSIDASDSGLRGELDLSGCTALEYLNCSYNQLTSLNVSDCTELRFLHCSDNQLTSLNVSECTELRWFDCSWNQLTSLNISGCTELRWLDCRGNQLTSASLKISGCTELQSLNCSYNQLMFLNVSDCTELWLFDCSWNQLTSLNVSGCTTLEYLNCSYNQLTCSTLPPTSVVTPDDYSYYKYSPQNDVFIASSLARNATLDLSREAVIDGTATVYTWHYANGNIVAKSSYTEVGGKFTFTGLNDGDVIYCTMTNAKFPELMLETTQVTIGVRLPGDANGDGIVDLADLAILARNWKKPGTWATGDF
ncbi:MAG: hypothetical protein FWD53_01150, partial [Phycisphaerales bacterium]|nr:hypothetical protein [Phycisphaerales bacterium]